MNNSLVLYHQAHDPKNLLGHKEKWKLAGKEKCKVITRAPTVEHIVKQTDFDDFVLVNIHYNSTIFN